MTPYLKAFLERLLPMAEPYVLEKGGTFYHPRRTRYPGTVLLSVCGFPEMAQFDHLSDYFKRVFGISFRAAILRTASEALPHIGPKLEEILEATERAGFELATKSKISRETLDTITQPLEQPELIGRLANIMWKTCIDEGLTPQEFWDRRIIPRPDSIETFLSIMKSGFNPTGAAEANAVLQFDFTGANSGTCQIKVKDRTIETAMGAQDEPSIVIEAPFEVWMDIITNKLDPQQAFMEQKCKATGDYEVLLKLGDWFAR
jgi:putative sterol carrier protein